MSLMDENRRRGESRTGGPMTFTRAQQRDAGRVKEPIKSILYCSKKDCRGTVDWAVFRWGQRKNGSRVRRGVRFVCSFHAEHIPEDRA